uniref:Secreted protein n=1 Tax=Heterorhabditis bacteriophora TaxID=37862 RepID=A0A1I7X621_HETBA
MRAVICSTLVGSTLIRFDRLRTATQISTHYMHEQREDDVTIVQKRCHQDHCSSNCQLHQGLCIFDDRSESGGFKPMNTPRVCRIVRNSIFKDNRRSMNKMDSELNVSPTSTFFMVKAGLTAFR